MHWILSLLFRPIGFILAGLGAMGLGISFLFTDPADQPAKSTLKQVAGVLDGATKITTKRRSGTSVDYELEIKPGTGESAKFKLPEREISEAQVKALLGRPISILSSASSDVWELQSGDVKVIEYEATKQRRIKSQEELKAAGPYVAGVGLLTSIIGMFWRSRRRSL